MDDDDAPLDAQRVLTVMKGIIGGKDPRPGQVQAVVRLVIEQKDTILVAATGYGKSIVLYAFSALRDKITVQIVPLTKLGESQRDDIAAKLPESKPVWIDKDVTLRNRDIWDQVQHGDYTHILLSPELATSAKFKAVLRSPEFHEKIGLFAIDELHCVSEWRDFRKEFQYLHTLRPLLPRNIPWFGCTATLAGIHQDFIIKKAGFDARNLEIIRTSVDRPEISIIIQPLLRNCLGDFRRLFFLLEGYTPSTRRDIPKTIVYIDNRNSLATARNTLINYLHKSCGFSKELGRKVVRLYDSLVRPTDKDIIYKDFASESTDCRICLATVSLGMGMDLPDVVRVVQFGMPPTPSIPDIWQRFRRAMRKPRDDGLQGKAYFFVPYWAFEHLGSDERQPRRRPTQRQQQRFRQPHAPRVSSRLMNVIATADDDENPDSDNDEDDENAANEANSNDNNNEESLDAGMEFHSLHEFTHKVKWSKADDKARKKMDPLFLEFLNAPCFRKAILDYLQEPHNQPDLEYKRPVPAGLCCNGSGCVPTLGRIPAMLSRAEDRDKAYDKPSTGSLADTAVKFVNNWCKEKAQELVPAGNRAFKIAPEMLMPTKLQYGVARLFADDSNARRNKVLPFEDLDGLESKLPALRQWEYKEEYGDALVEFCLSSVAKVHEDWEKDHPRPPPRQTQPRSRTSTNNPAGSPAASPARPGPSSLLANTLNRAAIAAAAAAQAVEANEAEEADEADVVNAGEEEEQEAAQPSTPARNLAVPAYVSQVTPIPVPVPGAPVPMAAPKTPKPPRKRAPAQPAQPTTPDAAAAAAAAAAPAPYSAFDTGAQQLMDELTPGRQAAPMASFQELLQRYQTEAAASPFPSPTAGGAPSPAAGSAADVAAAGAASPTPARGGKKRTSSTRTPIPGSPAHKK